MSSNANKLKTFIFQERRDNLDKFLGHLLAASSDVSSITSLLHFRYIKQYNYHKCMVNKRFFY